MILMKFLHFHDFFCISSLWAARGGVPGRGKGETEEGWQDGRMDGRTGGSEEDWEVGEDGEHGQDGGAMMLAVLLFVGRAHVGVDGCRTGTCIDVG